jgi:hypothetical protein
VKKGKYQHNIGNQWELFIERLKSSARSKIGHVFRMVKVIFGYRKMAYRGIKTGTDFTCCLPAQTQYFTSGAWAKWGVVFFNIPLSICNPANSSRNARLPSSSVA